MIEKESYRYLELESLVEGLTTAVTRLIRLGN